MLSDIVLCAESSKHCKYMSNGKLLSALFAPFLEDDGYSLWSKQWSEKPW